MRDYLRIMKKLTPAFYILAITVTGLLFCECSKKETRSYDELSSAGEIESLVRKEYADFFGAVRKVGGAVVPDTEGPDSTIIIDAARLTDGVIEDMRPFPSTLQSRISLDALSYAARDMSESPGFDNREVRFFWLNALLDPIFTKGSEYLKTGKANASTQVQIVTALKRGIGDKGTGDMLLDLISIVGPAPSDSVMSICESDTLVLKKVYDLLVYSRSLQEIGPPVWMMSGPWLVALDIEGWPLSFYCLKPLDLNNSYYLTFKDFTQGEIYAAAYDDPVPEESSQMDEWLSRASDVLDSLLFNDEFAERIRNAELPTYDTHNYYHDYLLAASADTVNTEFRVILKRDRVIENSFQYAGVDSIEIIFGQREILSRADTVTLLRALRYEGETMVAGRYLPARRGEGMAFLMPMGVHDEEILRRIRESMLPQITVGTE